MSRLQPLPLPASLTPADQDALAELFRRGTAENTLRAYEQDLAYIGAWKAAAFGAALAWPEEEPVALRFILDHARDLRDATGPAREAAEALVAAGLRRGYAAPAPSTLDRRIASWRAFHRMKNLPSPFDAPLIKEARVKARRAAARPRQRKSENPITREVLRAMLATCRTGARRDLRDHAALALAWASGGRRRSEVTALNFDDIDARPMAERGLIRIRLLHTKTTTPDQAPWLPLKGFPARSVLAWIEAAGITGGPLFRPVSQADRVLKRRLTPGGFREIVAHRLELAGYPRDFASPHGLRSGFLTQAALDGAPLAAAMQLSLHRDPAQAQKYYADVEIEDNPATDLLERRQLD
ncbi:tyrosine-type recombinase/integrase [Paracoccus sp. M683]|uniref:tyrosine-type recombinase/integrase n=2 Tax=Paracoccus TaxID=265 RepID=UPI00117DDB36|nr:tyrosine-type recombinase/integrase [Paracoccus sp. M683]TRW93152.1 tyrosine-type recombinase/integrase [Paracoccus sp. M683]